MEAGIPAIPLYQQVQASPEFKAMEAYSEAFLHEQRQILEAYPERHPDPLHHWSRQWEYPFTWNRLQCCLPELASAGQSPHLRILDAGSGITFFPFYLASKHENLELICCDQDRDLGAVYRDLREKLQGRVSFIPAEMGDIPCPTASLDAIYCISVLEHTTGHERILDEFHRLRRPLRPHLRHLHGWESRYSPVEGDRAAALGARPLQTPGTLLEFGC